MAFTNAVKLKDIILDKLPDTGEEWTSLPSRVEFQPAKGLSPLAEYHLRRLTTASSDDDDGSSLFPFDTVSDPYEQIFIDGRETYYDDYSQAWRALGFFIDCNYCDTYNDEDNGGYSQAGCSYLYNNDKDDRDEDHDRDHDEDEGEDENYYRDYYRKGCQRFMLWAAYVDEGYSGNRVGEYMYYDRKSGKWSDKACQKTKSSRCVKMDCHLPDTNFTLLGFFKEPQYDEWMEQLFKHQGDCVWTDEEYAFMQYSREAWPNGCTKSVSKTEYGYRIYYDVKPTKYGGMDIGLYTDSNCVTEYTGKVTRRQVLKSMVCGGYIYGGYNYSHICTSKNNEANEFEGGHGDNFILEGNTLDLNYQLNYWNDAFDVFKQCQPCKTFKLTDIVAGMGYEANKQGHRYNYTAMLKNYRYYYGDENKNDNNQNKCNNGNGNNGNNRNGNGNGNGNRNGNNYYNNNYNANDKCSCFQYGFFQCWDDADYCNVNQCMKFALKTYMLPASWKDIELAGYQGSITLVQLPGADDTIGSDHLDKYKWITWEGIRSGLTWLFFGFSLFVFLSVFTRYVRILYERALVARRKPRMQDDFVLI